MIYYSTQHLVEPGTSLKPTDNRILDIFNYNAQTFCKEIGREAWGYIDYSNPLTEQQASSYELIPLMSGEGRA